MRLIWIDAFVTAGEFLLNRQHLQHAFDISRQQASLDLSLFQEMFPARLAYDLSLKGYKACTDSTPAFAPWQHSAIFTACRAAADAARGFANG